VLLLFDVAAATSDASDLVSFLYLMHLILDAVENELSPNMQST